MGRSTSRTLRRPVGRISTERRLSSDLDASPRSVRGCPGFAASAFRKSMKRVLIQTSAAIVAIASFGACESRPSAPSTPSPISPSPQAPVPPPQPPPSRGQEVSTVSGVAYEHTAAGMQPVAGLPLHVEGRRDGKTWVTLDVVTDAAGRYEGPDWTANMSWSAPARRRPTFPRAACGCGCGTTNR